MTGLTRFQSPLIETIPHSGDVEPALRQMGWEWCVEDSCSNYLPGEAVALPEPVADELLEAADTLYDMFVNAIPPELSDEFLKTIGIPENLWPAVRHSWNDERHWHIYGRFDLAYTAQGIKLIEFNADTATAVPETAVVQWASLAAAGKAEARQSSGFFEAVAEQFRVWRQLNDDLDPYLMLTYVGESEEDRTNCEVLAEAAREAGFEAHLCPIEELTISEAGGERGVWMETEAGKWQQFPFLFKLLPWEQIAWEEPELADALANLILTRNLVVANPAYTLLFQSKGMLAWLWRAYPNHPLLLETELEPLSGDYVKKPFFGREGQNVEVVQQRTVTEKKDGEYAKQPVVYQRWCELPQDRQGHHYQAGVFWAGDACAIGFRREKGIISNLSQFVPHLLV